MTNHFSGIISAAFKQLHVDAMTELVTNCAVPCQIIYGDTLWEDCQNCLTSPMGTNYYDSINGSTPFSGICPVCNGKGRISTESTETINLSPIYNYKEWIDIGVPIQVPNGIVQTLSLFNTYEELRRAKQLIINTDINSYVKSRFEKYAEPHPCGLGAATIVVAFWKRIEY